MADWLPVITRTGVTAEVRFGLVQGDAVIIHPADTVHDGAFVSANH